MVAQRPQDWGLGAGCEEPRGPTIGPMVAEPVLPAANRDRRSPLSLPFLMARMGDLTEPATTTWAPGAIPPDHGEGAGDSIQGDNTGL